MTTTRKQIHRTEEDIVVEKRIHSDGETSFAVVNENFQHTIKTFRVFEGQNAIDFADGYSSCMEDMVTP